MRKITGTIGAALAIAAFIVTAAGSASHEASRPDGVTSFVGPADDSSIVDLSPAFDGINIDRPGRPMVGLGSQGGGQDDVSGFNAAFAATDQQNFGAVVLGPGPA